MPMQMGFRWYGEGNDKISLSDIKQIPGVTSIVWALHHKQPGEVWELDEIAEVKKQLEPYGFNMDVVESVNVHDDIKIGLPDRDRYIENYIQTVRNLSKFGVKVICYNFMPVFDWTRTDLFHPLPDGSTAMYYEKSKIFDDPKEMAEYILKNLDGMTFPGWEPERMARLDELFEAYRPVTREKLWENLKYFLDALMPVCRECGIKMAIHPDDPPWDIFGLPRLIVDEAAVERLLTMVDDPHNCLTLCSGSLSSNPDNCVAEMVRRHADRIAFAHIRNVKHYPNGDFSEASHRDCDGDTGVLEILRAYHDAGFEGYIRPDHGRNLWGETGRPGYGLYDRALGIMYMLGVWDMLDRLDEEKKRLRLTDIQAPGFDPTPWEKKGYVLPKFDIAQVRAKTAAAPTWIHFGAGNIFRAFPAAVLSDALDNNAADRGIIVAEGFDYDIIDRAYRPFDNRSLLVVLRADGQVEKRVIASITESLKADAEFADDWARLEEIFRAESLQMVSFTVTEKGYSVSPDDLKRGLQPQLTMGKLAQLLYCRFQAGRFPLTLQSMDNCSHNGDILRTAVLSYADAWVEQGAVPAEFADYLRDETLVSFPWSMIDKITPRPDPAVEEMLRADGFEDTGIIITDRHTYTAPFVNAEETEYLVVEDRYVNGRPALEAGGVLFTDRETVNKVERMKVCTCLNPLHTAMSIFGCLLGYTRIFEEMKDDDIRRFITIMGEKEAMPVVEDPGVIRPEEFMRAVIERRLPNPFMPDAPQRIATDTSAKLSIRFGETIKAYLEKGLSLDSLTLIPLVFAGYARYLRGVDDAGAPFEPSPDPKLSELRAIVSGLCVAPGEQDFACLRALFSRRELFGVDLYECGLGEKIEEMTAKLFAGPGAVRATLHEAVEQAGEKA